MNEKTDAILKLEDVSKSFGKKRVLERLNLQIREGEVFGIIGLSGSGKTTLLNTMIGFLEIDSGKILFKPEHLLDTKYSALEPIKKNMAELRKSFGFAAQEPSFYEKLTVYENLCYFGKLYGLSKEIMEDNINTILKLLDLEDSRNALAANLSGGMQKRLDIGCAIIHDPRVLILDEPTADLDPLLRRQMWNIIKDINNSGTTIVLSSHFLDELELLCDRVCVLFNKKIIAIGSPEELKRLYNKEENIIVETADGDYKGLIKEIRLGGLSRDIQEKEHKLIVKCENARATIKKIVAAIAKLEKSLVSIRIETPSLESILEKIIKAYNKES